MLRMLGVCLSLLLGCRGTSPGAQGGEIARLVDSLRPAVERATGLSFRGPTRSALKSREEIREYLVARLREDFPAQREEGIQAVYRLLGFIPDTLDLKALLLDLYTEQVAGFYDPETSTLYGVRGADPVQLRLVLAHELVHALQHRYLPLDSIMKSKGDADRQAAAQAVFEGQATLASIRVLVPGQDVVGRPEFWSAFREQIRTQQSSMQVFARAPLALREELIFPYLNGAEFMRWWDSAKTGQPLPTLSALPRSTEQILHPARYAANDAPVRVRFADSTADVLYEDTLGELEIQVLATVLRGGGEVLTDTPLGWGGDRFRIYRSSAGPALVWYTEWDDSASATRFRGGVGVRLSARERAGYRTSVEPVPGLERPTVRVVIAPAEWNGWAALPKLRTD
jgi:uncharacterized protein DUF6782